MATKSKFQVNADGFLVNEKAKFEVALSKEIRRAIHPVDYFTDDELAAIPVGDMFVYDVESYPNFFYIAFKHVKSGKVVDFEDSPGSTINQMKLNWMLWRFLLVGFNSKNYDILVTLLAAKGFKAAQLSDVTQEIIVGGLSPWEVERKYKIQIPPKLNHVDLIEVAPLMASLKAYGGRLHAKRLQDLPFPPGTHLTEDDARYVRNYCCANDLDITALMVVELRTQLELRTEMSIKYDIDLRSKSDAQIAEAVLSAEIAKLNGFHAKRPHIPDGTQFSYNIPDFIKYDSGQLRDMLEVIRRTQFTLDAGGSPVMPKELGALKLGMGQSVYKMGMGGLHSTEKSVAHVADANTIIVDIDVESFYPRIIINQKLYPKHLGPNFLTVYEGIVDTRVAAKRSGNKATANSLKIVINGSFGKLGSKWSILYAPDLMIQVTLTGQLVLLMLIERLNANGIEVISANTDGIVTKCGKDKLELLRQVYGQWEKDTNFVMEETHYKAVYSRDINNYIAVKKTFDKANKIWTDAADGCKTKGAYSNPWASKDDGIFRFHKNPETTVCIEAVTNLMLTGEPVESYIHNCTDVRKFIAVRNAASGAYKDGEYLGKVVRWYYAEGETGCIQKVGSGDKLPKSQGGRPLMDIDGMPTDINYDHYIQCANDILKDIGFYAKPKTIPMFF